MGGRACVGVSVPYAFVALSSTTYIASVCFFHNRADPSFIRQVYFQQYETNPALRDLPLVHADGLEYLFQRMAYLYSNPV